MREPVHCMTANDAITLSVHELQGMVQARAKRSLYYNHDVKTTLFSYCSLRFLNARQTETSALVRRKSSSTDFLDKSIGIRQKSIN